MWGGTVVLNNRTLQQIIWLGCWGNSWEFVNCTIVRNRKWPFVDGHGCKRLVCTMQNLLTYLLHAVLPSWEANGSQLVKKFPTIYRTRNFITALTSVRHLSLSWACSIQSIFPYPTFWRNFLILSSHLRLVLSSDLFPSGFPTESLYKPLLSRTRSTCSAYPILDFITRTLLGEQYR